MIAGLFYVRKKAIPVERDGKMEGASGFWCFYKRGAGFGVWF